MSDTVEPAADPSVCDVDDEVSDLLRLLIATLAIRGVAETEAVESVRRLARDTDWWARHGYVIGGRAMYCDHDRSAAFFDERDDIICGKCGARLETMDASPPDWGAQGDNSAVPVPFKPTGIHGATSA